MILKIFLGIFAVIFFLGAWFIFNKFEKQPPKIVYSLKYQWLTIFAILLLIAFGISLIYMIFVI